MTLYCRYRMVEGPSLTREEKDDLQAGMIVRKKAPSRMGDVFPVGDPTMFYALCRSDSGTPSFRRMDIFESMLAVEQGMEMEDRPKREGYPRTLDDGTLVLIGTEGLTMRQVLREVAWARRENPGFEITVDGDLNAIVGRRA